MDLNDFELIYKDNRYNLKDKEKVKAKLEEIVGSKNISMNNIDLLAYTKDTSLIAFNWTLEGKIAGLADFVIWPETVEHICEVLCNCSMWY